MPEFRLMVPRERKHVGAFHGKLRSRLSGHTASFQDGEKAPGALSSDPWGAGGHRGRAQRVWD